MLVVKRRSWKLSAVFLVVSIGVFLYIEYVLWPFIIEYANWQEMRTGIHPYVPWLRARPPTVRSFIQYFFMSLPVSVGYPVLSVKCLKRIYVTSLAYPIIILNLYIFFFNSLMAYAGLFVSPFYARPLWLGVSIFLAVLAAAFAFGLRNDINYFKNYKRCYSDSAIDQLR